MKKLLLLIIVVVSCSVQLIAQTGSDSITVKLNIFSKKVSYYQSGNKLGQQEFVDLIKTNETAYKQYNQANKQCTAGVITMFSGLFVYGFARFTPLMNLDKLEFPLTILSDVAIGGGTIVYLLGLVGLKNTADIYNGNLNSTSYKPKSALSIGITSNGIGMIYNF